MAQLLNQYDPKHRKMFENLQGNILKGHGRNNTYHLFFKIKDTSSLSKPMQNEVREGFKNWLRNIADEHTGIITDAKTQLEQILHYKKTKNDGGLFACIHLSYTGYCKLLGQAETDQKIDTSSAKNLPAFLALRGGGMKNADLNDTHGQWEAGYQQDIDGMLLLADNNLGNLEAVQVKMMAALGEFAEVVAIEKGCKLLNKEGAGIEHFGYVDGVSQPLFFEDEMEAFLAEHGIKDPQKLAYNPAASPDLVLLDDPFIRHAEAYGSFFVFRKLEQNVRGFKKAEKDLGYELGLLGEDKERVGAMIVGRFEDGTPLQVSDEEGIIGRGHFNNFNYNGDISKCPFHAHIRKTNPRNDLPDAQSHVMARRGIPYGTREDEPNDGVIENKPTKGVGLLFMSYQASIPNQFEVIQRHWANDPNFLQPNTGIDLIIGQGGYPSSSEYLLKWGGKPTQKASFNQFVTMRGGEYFFTPSIPFLRNL
jgi:Dyp-type peroxidase family